MQFKFSGSFYQKCAFSDDLHVKKREKHDKENFKKELGLVIPCSQWKQVQASGNQ